MPDRESNQCRYVSQFLIKLGPVHTNADSKVNGIRFTENASIDPRSHYRFHSVSDRHTDTLRIRSEVDFPSIYGHSSSLSFSKDGRDILNFSFHSSGTIVCKTKLSHHALVRPGRIQNLLALASRVFEPNRRYEVLQKAISRKRIVLLLCETNKRLKRARFNSKQAIKNRSIFCFAMFVLIVDFGARACYSTTWYS